MLRILIFFFFWIFVQSSSGKMRSPGKGEAAAKAEEEFEVEEVKDRTEGSLGSQLALVTQELGLNMTAATPKRRFSRERIVGEASDCRHGYIFRPDNKYAVSPLSFPLPNFPHFV